MGGTTVNCTNPGIIALVFCLSVFCLFYVYPNLDILRSIDSLRMQMRRPSTVMSFSATNPERVRIALDVVMLDRLAKSSRAM